MIRTEAIDHPPPGTLFRDPPLEDAGGIQVMIVEDDPTFFSRFCKIVTMEPDFELFAAVRNGASARDCLTRAAPDVLLVDLGLPDMSGIDIIREAAQRHPDTDIMVVSVFGDEEHVLASIEAGATGYVLKDSVPEEFSGLIKQMRAGGSPISPLIARQLLQKLRPAQTAAFSPSPETPALSTRETEVLSLLAKGFSFCEIARMLEISPHTVTTYVKKIYRKLAVHSRAEAVYEASQLGLVK
jgi:DNA-binding NarL/FixJ family response regulator